MRRWKGINTLWWLKCCQCDSWSLVRPLFLPLTDSTNDAIKASLHYRWPRWIIPSGGGFITFGCKALSVCLASSLVTPMPTSTSVVIDSITTPEAEHGKFLTAAVLVRRMKNQLQWFFPPEFHFICAVSLQWDLIIHTNTRSYLRGSPLANSPRIILFCRRGAEWMRVLSWKDKPRFK